MTIVARLKLAKNVKPPGRLLATNIYPIGYVQDGSGVSSPSIGKAYHSITQILPSHLRQALITPTCSLPARMQRLRKDQDIKEEILCPDPQYLIERLANRLTICRVAVSGCLFTIGARERCCSPELNLILRPANGVRQLNLPYTNDLGSADLSCLNESILLCQVSPMIW